MRLGKEVGDRGGDHRADALDIVEIGEGLTLPILGFAHGLKERVDAAVMSGEKSSGGLADMAHTERIDEAVETNVAARVDGVEQIAGGGLAPAFALGKLGRGARIARLQGEDVGRRLDQPFLVEGLDVLLAETLDVEGIARDEMLEPLDALGGADQPAGAAPDRVELAGHRIDLADGVAAAGRADFRKLESFRALRPLVLNRPRESAE